MANSADNAPSNTDEFFSSSGINTINTPDTGDKTQTQSLAAVSGLSSEENAEKGIELHKGDSKASENIDDSELSEHNTPSLLDANAEQLSEQIETVQEKTEKSSQLEPTIATSADIDVNFEQDTTQMTGSESVVNNTSVGGDSDAIDNKDLATDLPGNIGAECETSEVLHSPTATTPDSDSKPATGFGEGVLNSASSGKESTDDEATREVQSASQEQPIESLYHIKWIKWKGINTPIITQNENGPCPLLAVVNVLLLQRRINIPSLQEIVTAGQLMEYIGDCILEEAPKRLSEGAQLNYEQNMHDAIAIMNKLQTGLDVNVKFTGVSDFEFTPECIVFDLLAIGLYHGWLIDPQNTHTVSAVGPLSYNQLVEKIIASKQEDVESELAVSEGLIGEAFLEQTASQLTYHGLCELNSQLKNDQLCVFFRNNHFSTLYKHKDELFLLVTDQGFLTEDRVIWESLSNVEGDSNFVSAEFRTLPVERTPTAATNPPLGQGYSQEDQDYLVALSLQNEQEQAARVAQPQVYPGGPALPPPPSQGPSSIQQGSQSDQEWTDLQLALQLQEEEQRQQAQQQQQLQQAEQRISTRPQQGHMPAARPVNAPQPQQRNTPQQRPEANEKCNIL